MIFSPLDQQRPSHSVPRVHSAYLAEGLGEGLGLRTVRPAIFALSALYSAQMQQHSAGDFVKELEVRPHHSMALHMGRFFPARTAEQCVASVPKPSVACGGFGAGAAFVGTGLEES